jgi:hypothetical protein
MFKLGWLLVTMFFMYQNTSWVRAGTEAEMRALLAAKLNSSDYSPRVRPIKDTGNVMTVSIHYILSL